MEIDCKEDIGICYLIVGLLTITTIVQADGACQAYDPTEAIASKDVCPFFLPNPESVSIIT